MIFYWALPPVVRFRSCLFLFVLVRACCLVRFPLARNGLLELWLELLFVGLGFASGWLACSFVLVRAGRLSRFPIAHRGFPGCLPGLLWLRRAPILVFWLVRSLWATPSPSVRTLPGSGLQW